MSERLNFTKPEDVEKFESLPKYEKNILVNAAHEEANEMQAEKLVADKAFEQLKSHFSPEAKIERLNITIGGKKKNDLIGELFQENRKKRIYFDSADIMNNEKFTTLERATNIELVCVSPRDFGFLDRTSAYKIFEKASELGLDLGPAEVGPYLALQLSPSEVESLLSGSSSRGYVKKIYVAMDGIVGNTNYGVLPNMFNVGVMDSDKENKLTSLGTTEVGRYGFDPDNRFIFALRIPKSQ